jgi:glycosyltransferase involved in cell wall biosynthesis
MITIVIPTRNRAYTLAKVADSYYKQKYVDEIIFVDDCGEDNTEYLVNSFAIKYSYIKTRYIKHPKRSGAAAGRITGYSIAKNNYILFCDDDEFLEDNYTSVCLLKLLARPDIGIVSGRRIYKLYGESNSNAKKRFGFGTEHVPAFNFWSFGFNDYAIYEGDIELPLTNSIILTKKELLLKYGYDSFYARGNGYREESDFQMNLFVNGFAILVTNDTHSFHLSGEEVKSGGQRTSRLLRLFWNVYYTNYFFNKYYNSAKARLKVRTSKYLALTFFCFSQIYLFYIKPGMKAHRYIVGKLFG